MPRDHRNGTVCLTAQQQLAFREASNLRNQDYTTSHFSVGGPVML
jgi:hypothetical protein